MLTTDYTASASLFWFTALIISFLQHRCQLQLSYLIGNKLLTNKTLAAGEQRETLSS